MLLQQFLMCSSAGNPALFHKNNLIRIHHGSQPVGNDNRGPALHQVRQGLLHHRLRLAVKT
ncbi:hypothetical protein D3C75_1371960 [compost metagenome]